MATQSQGFASDVSGNPNDQMLGLIGTKKVCRNDERAADTLGYSSAEYEETQGLREGARCLHALSL